MRTVHLYSTMPHKKALEVLSREGFRPTKRRDFLLEYPLGHDKRLFWDPYEWFMPAPERNFLVYPEPIIAPKRDERMPMEYRLADNFDYEQVMQYHKLTHELPSSVITTADESLVEFLEEIRGDNNPFLKVVKALDKSVVIHGKQAYDGLIWVKKMIRS